MIVVDASLAAKWTLWEEDSSPALRFLFHFGRQLCAPDILFTEVAHAIVRHANESRARGQDIADDALEALRKWTIAWGEHAVKPHRGTQARLYKAGRIAVDLGHPLPDCIYLTLAMELKCELATCDAKFRKKAAGYYKPIRLLAEYDLPPLPHLRED